MPGSVSSAEPDKLIQYAKRGQWITFHLDLESNQLANHLKRFEHLCTEPNFRVPTTYLVHHLRNFSNECKPIDEWVEKVGNEFLQADQSKLYSEMRSENLCASDLDSTTIPIPNPVPTPSPSPKTEHSSDEEWLRDLINEDEDYQLLVERLGKLGTIEDMAGIVYEIRSVPKYRTFMETLIKYEKGVQGARRASKLTPDVSFSFMAAFGISVKQLESLANYTVGEKQNKPIERLYAEFKLNPIIYVVSDISGDVAGTLSALLGAFCGPKAPICSPVFYVGGNYLVGETVEGGLDWVRDVYLDQKYENQTDVTSPVLIDTLPEPVPTPLPTPFISTTGFESSSEQWITDYSLFLEGKSSWQQCTEQLRPLLDYTDPPRIEGMIISNGAPQWAGIYFSNGRWLHLEEPSLGQAKQ